MKIIKIESCEECPYFRESPYPRVTICFCTQEKVDDIIAKLPEELFKSCPLEDMPTIKKVKCFNCNGEGGFQYSQDPDNCSLCEVCNASGYYYIPVFPFKEEKP